MLGWESCCPAAISTAANLQPTGETIPYAADIAAAKAPCCFVCRQCFADWPLLSLLQQTLAASASANAEH